jgi:hypothetical protein
MKVIPMNPETSYRKYLAEVMEAYKFSEQSEETQGLLKKVFRAGWIASKKNTFEILETINSEANDGTKQ